MKKKLLLIFILSLSALDVMANISVVSCTSDDPKAKFELSPSIYVNSKTNTLCFNVTSWNQYKGGNCVTHNGQARWSAVVIMFDERGNSLGRDNTDFRVSNVSITNESIAYFMEWGRSGRWLPKQRIEINRLTGGGVDWFVTEHGGLSIKCVGRPQKF